MTDGVVVLFGVVGAAATVLAVLVPLIRALCREIDTLRADVGEVRRDLHGLS